MKAGEILVASYGLMCTNLDALKEITNLQTPVPRDKPEEQSEQTDAASSNP